MDAQARAAYKRRVEELREELEEATRFNDPARAAKAQAEIEFITNELAAAYGVRGHARRREEDVEKIRKAVTNSLRNSLAKLRTAHPALWRHLFATVKTGTFCVYMPDQPIEWEM